MKRIASCLLVVFLLLCLLPVQVMAAEETVSAELVLENSGLKTADNRAVYKLHFRLFGEEIGNVAMAYIAIDNTVFDIGMLNGEMPAVSTLIPTADGVALPSGHYQFRTVDTWENGYVDGVTGSSAVSTDGAKYYVRLEADRGWGSTLPYSDYTAESYTADAPAIGTIYLILKDGQTATTDAVNFITTEEATSFNAPSAIFACNAAGDFFLHNAASGAVGEAIASATVRLVEQASKLEVVDGSAYSIDSTTGYLCGVAEQTTMATLLAQLKNNANTLKVYDKSGNEITDTTAMLGTGAVVKLMNGDTVIQSVTVVVKGDVTGDAKINMLDVISIRRYMINNSTYSIDIVESIDVNDDEKYNMLDVIALRRYLINSTLYPLN